MVGTEHIKKPLIIPESMLCYAYSMNDLLGAHRVATFLNKIRDIGFNNFDLIQVDLCTICGTNCHQKQGSNE